ncbi:MAG TPA: hypothetical protein VK465_00350, partial [Fibrobacteria bacterium]|nr:hypothetical protein [Fibrobacteria bacterium]
MPSVTPGVEPFRSEGVHITGSARARGFSDIGIDFLAVVVSRAAMFVVLFLATWNLPADSLARAMVLVYGLSTILYLATWASFRRFADASPVGVLLFFQFLVELAVEAALFVTGGGYHSDYALLFVLTILSSGVFFQFWGSAAMASLATAMVAYAGAVHTGMDIPWDLPLSRLHVDAVHGRFWLLSCLFFLVALLSSSLSRKLAAVRRELEGTHRALDRYQFSAESMMNDLPTGLLFFDAAGILKYRNKLGEEWLERRLQPGMSREEVLQGLLGVDILQAMERMGGGFPVREMEIESPSGRPLHVQVKVLAQGGEHLGTVLT